jgi:hypothetical protein
MTPAKQNNKEVEGAIVRYTSNQHNDVDGLVIDRQGDLVEVKFPPHTARFVRDIAAEGDTVRLALHEKPKPSDDGHKHSKSRLDLTSIENTTTHQQFNIGSVKPPHPPETGHLVSFTVPKPQFTRGGKHDEITGVIFEDKFIHLHPKEYEEGEEALASAEVLQIKAKRRTADTGFVNAGGYTVYHAHSLTIGEN